jgi:hypothetical protein
MEVKLRAHPGLRKTLEIKGISGSQLCRCINDLPTEMVQKMFVKVVNKILFLTQAFYGLSIDIGRLNIVDLTGW